VTPQRWLGIDAARSNTPLPGGQNAAYQAGYKNYNEGVTASRQGTAVTRFGRGFSMGYRDYGSGIEHAHTNPIAKAPTVHAEKLAHAEYWAGKGMALTRPLATVPVNNRAHIAGHADYWAGVAHAKTKPLTMPPTGRLAKVDGHTDYWAGVTHGITNPKGIPPVGNLAAVAGHTDFWEGVAAAAVDHLAPLPPSSLGKTKGHADYRAGVEHAKASPRNIVPASANLATTTACTDYWQGVDHARTNPRNTAFPTPSAAATTGVKDYWAGVDTGRANMAGLEGTPPAGGGNAEGFTAYRTGVEAHKAGQPTAGPAAADLGWNDAKAGVADAQAYRSDQAPDPKQTHGGYLSGYFYAVGVIRAAAGHAAPSGATHETVAATGHGHYLGGAQSAHTGTGAPTDLGGAHGHADYQAGVDHAKANPRHIVPPSANLATTTACTEYWKGVDHARSNPRDTAYPNTSAAATAGLDDYWAGVDHAVANPQGGGPAPRGGSAEGAADYWRGEQHAAGNRLPPAGVVAATAHNEFWAGAAHASQSLLNLQGPSPVGRVRSAGFLAYRGGATAADHHAVNQPANLAFSDGWSAFDAARTAVRNNHVDPANQESGYLYGVQRTPLPVPKRRREEGGEPPLKRHHA